MTDLLREALAVALRGGCQEPAARAYANLVSTLASAYRMGEAEAYLQEGLEYADDHELKQHLLRVALKGAELVPGEGRTALSAESFGDVAREFLLAEAVIERLARLVDPAALRAILGGVRLDLSSESVARGTIVSS